MPCFYPRISDSSTSVIGKLLLLVLGSVEWWLGADEMHFFRVMVVKWIVMHSCWQCSRQVNSITPQHHNTTSLNTCCKYLMRTLKILQHLIIYLAFEIHIFMAPTGDHTTYTTNPFWCPTMQWQEGKWRENKNTGIMMNYVANHHVSDGWLIDSGKQLDAPVGMAGFLFMLGSSIVSQWMLGHYQKKYSAHPSSSLSMMQYSQQCGYCLASCCSCTVLSTWTRRRRMEMISLSNETCRGGSGEVCWWCVVMYSSLSLDLQFCVKSL